MGLQQALSFSGSDGKQTVCAVACLLQYTLEKSLLATVHSGEKPACYNAQWRKACLLECTVEKWQSVGMASQADADYGAGGIP